MEGSIEVYIYTIHIYTYIYLGEILERGNDVNVHVYLDMEGLYKKG